MFTDVRVVGSVCLGTMVAMALLSPRLATPASAAEIDCGVDAAVQALYDKVPEAQALAAQARAITVAMAVSRCASRISSASGTACPVMPSSTGSKQRLFRV
jgi:hypothetical protein